MDTKSSVTMIRNHVPFILCTAYIVNYGLHLIPLNNIKTKSENSQSYYAIITRAAYRDPGGHTVQFAVWV